jgi:hypothetical protein
MVSPSTPRTRNLNGATHEFEDHDVILEGVVRVDCLPAEAFHLFTPSGERLWAGAEWDPCFFEPEANEIQPATVFEVAHGDTRATWIVVDAEPGRGITYAQVIPGQRAGLIAIRLEAAGSDRTEAHVTYAMTPLSEEGEARLGEFQRHFDAFLAHWEQSIATALREGSGGDARRRRRG